MNRRMILAGLISATSAVGIAHAEMRKSQIVGSWSVVSVVTETDGKSTEPFGPTPQGMFIFTADGYFSANIIRPGRTKFASKNREAGSAEENKKAVAGNISSFGRYAFNSDGSITLSIIGSNFPNWDGTQQRRVANIVGDEMTYTNPTPSLGAGVSVLKLMRTSNWEPKSPN